MTLEQDRFLGCLLGLASGDAVGTTLEFHPPGTFNPLEDMIGGGPFNLQPGEWTDDTSMALCLAESLIRQRAFNARDQMDRYCLWEATGHLSSNGRCFDIGNTVQRALSTYRLSDKSFAGSSDPLTAGNGSLMRLAPVPMFFASDATHAIHYSGESSRTTHGAVSCIDACRYFGGLLWMALHGVSKEDLLAEKAAPPTHSWNNAPLCPEIDKIASGSFKQKHPPQIKGTGYVVHSLEAALWAFHHSHDFRSGCLLAANLGDDADTTSAIYGQIAGAHYGHRGIPVTWLTKLARRTEIEAFSIELWQFGRVSHAAISPANSSGN